MVALAKDRNTPARDGDTFDFGVAAGVKIFAGALVALNATGFATPGAVATTLISIGRAEEQVDNTGGADGAVTVKIRKGVFRFLNSAAGDEIVATDIGADCFIVDDQTVAKTNGTATRSVAGKVVDLDAQGVWVEFA